jgi:competence CoiA-like predicted nuclease
MISAKKTMASLRRSWFFFIEKNGAKYWGLCCDCHLRRLGMRGSAFYT